MTEDVEISDVEIGRYALRTFILNDGKLWSLTRLHHWKNGAAEAICLQRQPKIYCSSTGTIFNDLGCGKSVPNENCSCGIYGLLSLRSLFSQYSGYSKRSIAVIAAEGATIIGPEGLRTAAARIVGYWCADEWRRDIYAKNCSEANPYETVNDLAEAFNFDPLSSSDTAALLPRR